MKGKKNNKTSANALFYRDIKNKHNNKISGAASLLMFLLIGIFFLPKIAFATQLDPEKLIELTNKEREKYGVDKLMPNQPLFVAAKDKASTILKTQTFQHNINGKKFSGWVRESGYQYSYIGENLAIDFSTCEGIIKAWMESDLHRKNLLNPRFADVGIAAVEGEFEGEATFVVVQIFGEPMNKKIKAASEINHGYLYGQGSDSASPSPKKIFPLNLNTERGFLFASLFKEMNSSHSVDFNYLLAIIDRNETISTNNKQKNIYSADSIFLHWCKNGINIYKHKIKQIT